MNRQKPSYSHEVIGSLIPVLLFVLFLSVYLNSFHRDDTVFDENFDTVFGLDTGDYALATQTPGFGEFSDGPLDEDSSPRPLLDAGYSSDDRDDFTSEGARLRWLERKYARSNRRLTKVRKHLLFQHANHIVYSSFKSVWKPLAAEWTISHERKAIVFPSALFGALTVALLFLLFRRNTRDLVPALMFSLLFGFSMSKWFFSGVPETHSLQMLLAAVFIFVLLEIKDPGWKQSVLLGFIIGLAVLVGFNNVLFFIPAGFLFVMKRRWTQGVLCFAVASALVISAYGFVAAQYNPEVSLLKSVSFVRSQVDRYTGLQASFFERPWLEKPLFTAENLLFFSVGAARFDPSGDYGISAFRTYFRSVFAAGYLLVYVFFLFLLVRDLIFRFPKQHKAAILSLGSWLLVHFLFFMNFNAGQAFIYSGLFLVPLMPFYFFGYSGGGGARFLDSVILRRMVLGVLVIFVVVNNYMFILRYLR